MENEKKIISETQNENLAPKEETVTEATDEVEATESDCEGGEDASQNNTNE